MASSYLKLFAVVVTLWAAIGTESMIITQANSSATGGGSASLDVGQMTPRREEQIEVVDQPSSSSSSPLGGASTTTTTSGGGGSSSSNNSSSSISSSSISVHQSPVRSTTTTPEPDIFNHLEPFVQNVNYTFEKQLRIELIKQDILNRLGMTTVPDVSRVNMSVQERRQILRLYKKSMEELHGKKETSLLFDDDQFYANQFRSFTEYGDKPTTIPDRLWRAPRRKYIFFSVDIPEPTDPRKETIVKSATLKLYKRAVSPQHLAFSDMIDRSVRIDIYQILQVSGDRMLRRSVDSRLISLDKAAWEEFDVSRAVQEWIRDPATNLGLEIACDVRYRMEDLIDFTVWSPSVADNAYQSSLLPVLNVLTQEKRILGRVKRSLPERNDCVQGDGEERCCRYPLTITFREINWQTWVIQPESYQAYYCAGTCPRGYKVAHRFATIKSLLRDRNPSSVPALECTQTRMGSLNIAHYNSEGQAVVSVIENMYPEECACA